MQIRGGVASRRYPLTLRVFALVIVSRRLIAFITCFGGCLRMPNAIVSMIVRPAFSGTRVMVGKVAACRRLAVNRYRDVIGAATEDAVRQHVQTGYDDYKLVH